MSTFEYTYFPKELHRNILKELDLRFWTIFLIAFMLVNSSVLLFMNTAFETSALDKQKYLQAIYKVKQEPKVDTAKLAAELERQQMMMERRKQADKEEKVTEEREKRAGMSDAEKAAKRAGLKKGRTEKSAASRKRAASMFAAAGVSGGPGGGGGGRGVGGVGKGGIGPGGGGSGRFSGIGGAGIGITSGGRQSMGGLSKVVTGGTYEKAAGDIDLKAVEAGDVEAGELGGGLEMEAVEEVKGEGAKNVLRSPDVLNEIIQSKAPSIQRCFEKSRKKDPQLNGRLTIKFTIMPDGTVARLTIKSNWSNPRLGTEVDECVRGRVENWRFDVIPSGEVVVEFPMSFY